MHHDLEHDSTFKLNEKLLVFWLMFSLKSNTHACTYSSFSYQNRYSTFKVKSVYVFVIGCQIMFFLLIRWIFFYYVNSTTYSVYHSDTKCNFPLAVSFLKVRCHECHCVIIWIVANSRNQRRKRIFVSCHRQIAHIQKKYIYTYTVQTLHKTDGMKYVEYKNINYKSRR